MSKIIRVEHLKYVYNPGMPDETTALDDVSFSVEEGDFVGIIGSTGSGKSTLISHFNGLNRPTSGRILIDGKDMWEQGADLRAFRFQVGLVMQYPEYQLFEETCAKDIAYGPRNMGLDEAEIDRRVKEAAAFVGLSDELLQKSPFELSGHLADMLDTAKTVIVEVNENLPWVYGLNGCEINIKDVDMVVEGENPPVAQLGAGGAPTEVDTAVANLVVPRRNLP